MAYSQEEKEAIIEKILEALRRGVYEWVAAQQAGIHPDTLSAWKKKDPELRRRVEQAKAEARAKAEAWVYEKDPFRWLRFGPGRERPGVPGWTDRVEVTGPGGGPLEVRIVGWQGLEDLFQEGQDEGPQPPGAEAPEAES